MRLRVVKLRAQRPRPRHRWGALRTSPSWLSWRP